MVSLNGLADQAARPLRAGGLLLAGVLLLQGASIQTTLADLAERADTDAVLSALRQGGQPNRSQADGMTALHWACHHDDLRLAQALLKSGADASLTNRYGVTPLALAAQNGNAALLRLLLAEGADPNQPLRGGETPLMTAARTGVPDAVRVLLGRGATVDAVESLGGQSALMWAAAEGHVEVVRELVAAGARIDARLPSGFTPFLFAVREGQLGVVDLLLAEGADPGDTIRPPPDAPSRARGYRGAPPFGTSALLIAVENAHFEVGVRLLDAGADPNAAKPGYTVLHAMARVRKPGVGDNDPPPEGSGKMTSIEFVQELVRRGGKLEARMSRNVNLGNTRLNKLGATPFFLAAQSADAGLMRALADLGADTRATNADGSTPLMAAAGLGTRSPGEDAGTEEEVLEAVALALELGADLHAVDSNGETVMHSAAYKNLPRVVEFLAASGADVGVWNRPNVHGWTPLAIATGYRFGNFKPSPVTIAALRKAMLAQGVVPPERVEAVTKQIY